MCGSNTAATVWIKVSGFRIHLGSVWRLDTELSQNRSSAQLPAVTSRTTMPLSAELSLVTTITLTLLYSLHSCDHSELI